MKWPKWTAVGLVLVLGELTLSNVAITQEDNQVQSRTVSKSTQNNNYLKKLPPLIDREVFFGDPQIANAQLSPDGKFLAFQKPLNGVMNIWVKRLGEPFEAAHPVTADTDRPIPKYSWSEDGRYILYGQDKGGNENFHIYAVAVTAVPGKSAPSVRDLTPLENIQALLYAVPKKTPNYIIVGLNDRNPQVHDVYRINLTTGDRQLLIKNDRNVASWIEIWKAIFV